MAWHKSGTPKHRLLPKAALSVADHNKKWQRPLFFVFATLRTVMRYAGTNDSRHPWHTENLAHPYKKRVASPFFASSQYWIHFNISVAGQYIALRIHKAHFIATFPQGVVASTAKVEVLHVSSAMCCIQREIVPSCSSIINNWTLLVVKTQACVVQS
jgi:hypothetical protein